MIERICECVDINKEIFNNSKSEYVDEDSNAEYREQFNQTQAQVIEIYKLIKPEDRIIWKKFIPLC
jgi:hypothetical protein